MASALSIASAGNADPISKILRTGNLSLVAQELAAAVLSGITSDDIPAVISFTAVNKADIVSAGTCPPDPPGVVFSTGAEMSHRALAVGLWLNFSRGVVQVRVAAIPVNSPSPRWEDC